MKPESKLYNMLCEICERNGIGVAAKSWGMESGYFGSTGLEDYASDVDALALVNGSTDGKVRNRLIFLGDNLSGFREAYVFAHEIGHCVLGQLEPNIMEEESDKKREGEADMLAVVMMALLAFNTLKDQTAGGM